MSFAEQLRAIFNTTSTVLATVNSAYSTNLIFARVYDVVKRECVNQARGMTPNPVPPPEFLSIPRARTFVLDTTATVNAVAAVTVIPPPVLPQPGDPGYPYNPLAYTGIYVATAEDIILIRDMLIKKLTSADMGLTVTPTGPVNLTIAW